MHQNSYVGVKPGRSPCGLHKLWPTLVHVHIAIEVLRLSIRNTCMFFIISDKLEVLSELHNDGKISQGNTISVNYSMV